MLASADTHPTPYPQTGSAALYRGDPVTIYQRMADGRALVHGAGITARVPLDDLSPADAGGLFDQWRTDRLDRAADPDTLTAEVDLYVDFACWLEARGYDRDLSGTPAAFARRLSDVGYTSRRVRVRSFVPGRTCTAPAWHTALVGEGA